MTATKRTSPFKGKVASNAQKTANTGSSYGYLKLPKDVNVFSPDPEGSVKLDFMPYMVTDSRHPDRDADNDQAVEGSPWYRRPFRVHRSVGVDNDTVICLSSIGKKCPICDYKAKRAKDGADKEELKTLNYSKRNLYVVIPIGSKKFESVPHIFDMSDYLFQELLTTELKEDPDKEIFPDPVDGLTLKIRFEPGSFVTTKPYAQADRIDFLERDEVYDEDIAKDMPNLDEILDIFSYSELEAKFQEIEEDSDGGKLKPKDKDDDNEKETKPTRSISERTKHSSKDKDEADAIESKKPTRTVTRTTAAEKPVTRTSSKKEEECPYGHRFGRDTEKFDDCDNCDLFDACLDAKEAK